MSFFGGFSQATTTASTSTISVLNLPINSTESHVTLGILNLN
jgi:hypothetical protein